MFLSRSLLAIYILFSFIGVAYSESTPDAYHKQGKEVALRTTIKGIEKSIKEKAVFLRYYRDNISFEEDIIVVPVVDNEFSVSFNLEEATSFLLAIGENEFNLFLEPGDELFINLNNLHLKNGLVFSGKGGDANQYLNDFQKAFRQWNDDYLNYEMMKRNPRDFRWFMDYLRGKKWSFYKNYRYAAKVAFSNIFRQYAFAEIDYWYAYHLTRFRVEHSVANGLPTPITLDKSYYSYFKDILISNDFALTNRNYLYFIDQYVHLRREQPELWKALNIEEHTAKVIVPNIIVMAYADQPPILAEIGKGTELKYLGEKSEKTSQMLIGDRIKSFHWYKVRTIDGVTGWALGGGLNLQRKKENTKNFLTGNAAAYYQANEIFWESFSNKSDSLHAEKEAFLVTTPHTVYHKILASSLPKNSENPYELVSKLEINNQPIEAYIVGKRNDEKETIVDSKPNEDIIMAILSVAYNKEQSKETTVQDAQKSQPAENKGLAKVSQPAADFQMPAELLQRYEMPISATPVSGKVKNHRGDPLEIVLYTDPVLLQEMKHEVKFNHKNSFELDLELSVSVTGRIAYGALEMNVYFEPGDKQTISFEGNDFKKSLKFSGKGGVHNQYLQKAKLAFIDNDKELKTQIEKATPDEFLVFMNQSWENRISFLDNFSGRAKFSKAFYAFAKAEIEYWVAYNLMNYPWEYPLMNDLDPPLEVPAHYYDFLQKISVQADGALPGLQYCYFLDQFFDYQTGLKENEGLDKVDLAEKFLHNDVLYYFVAKEYAIACKRGRGKKVAAEIAAFIRNCPNELYNNVLRQVYAETKGLEIGDPAPDFNLTDLAGKPVKLSDFRGKIIYLDFWATWCSPCMHQMQNSRHWKSSFKNKDVVFLYVSLDKDKVAWENYLRSQQIQGVHVLASGGNVYQSRIAKLYKVKRMPAVFLVDKQGKVAYSSIKSKSHARVSDHINALLYSN